MFRTRRLRKTENIRRLVRETKLSVDDFVYPLFIEEGENIENEIVSMPGIKRFSLDRIKNEFLNYNYLLQQIKNYGSYDKFSKNQNEFTLVSHKLN